MIVLYFVEVDEMNFVHEGSGGELLIFLDEKVIKISVFKIFVELKIWEDVVESIVVEVAQLLYLLDIYYFLYFYVTNLLICFFEQKLFIYFLESIDFQ